MLSVLVISRMLTLRSVFPAGLEILNVSIEFDKVSSGVCRSELTI